MWQNLTRGVRVIGTWGGFKMSNQNDKNTRWASFVKKTKSKGLGDTIAKITSSVGIKPCGGCKKRQEALNQAFPYKKQ